MLLRRISNQSDETFEAYYSDFAAEYGILERNPALKMLELVHALEALPHATIWAFTSHIALVLATRDDYQSAVVRIEFSSGQYSLIEPIGNEEPRFIGEIKTAFQHNDPQAAAIAAIDLFDRMIEA
jgi:hypothetical protein